MRLAELRWHACRFAEAVRYGEQALTLDPLSEWTRRLLIRLYVDLQEPELARNVAATAPRVRPVRMLPVYLYQRDWARAAEITFAAVEDETLLALDEPLISAALRMHARTSGQYDRAIALLERVADVSWDAEGKPRLPKRLGVLQAAAALADTLVESGERDKGLRLARMLIADMDRASKDLQQGEFWYAHERAIALAILGDREGTLRALEAELANRPAGSNWWFTLESEPLFEPLHDDPRYRQLVARVHAHVHRERDALQRLRAEGLVTRVAN
jgi:tetratricopeptide (TPR) repeat protein